MTTKKFNPVRKRKITSVPEYKSNPSSLSVTVYDLQGDPLSTDLAARIEQTVQALVSESGVQSLAINVARG